ncbi:uncharacterized protein LY89DRAFT_718892 [Mollisia scopiformis]|uniref:Glycosyltransferase family 31 protein n=1 Tax=Mollisia scopiformis TaxID=149040 RepID=A0A194XAP9_MOLSC|nr:uncharacterized protein LY89DRAFT_718892 [Mollisia scopiformis]KUJ17250.1 hypothetical protein LY89DRAFT_718892 [Mollisia scopiformis]
MISNPFSRPTRTIFFLVIFLLAGMFYYRPVHELASSFPHPDTGTLHQYLNRSDHAQKPLTFISKLQKQLRHSVCIPDTTVVSSTRHHYRTGTKTATKTIISTRTEAVLQPTCDPVIDAPRASKEDATPEQLAIAKLRDEGIVVIFKTGAQEVSHLAIQIGTTLRYISSNDILFFSDQQGSIGPFLINDALRNVDQKLKNEHRDFEIYRQIKEYQSTGQDILEMPDEKKGADRPGWRLDKYKFIHMVEETFEMRPDAKWYVFIETDSYVFWDNLAEWLKRLDPKKPWYIGSGVTSSGILFAHGGSGYILSNAAMNKFLGPDQPQGLAASWDARMAGLSFGDLALGIALKEKGVTLSIAHPLLNGYKPSTFTYGPGSHWCQPVVTMHHIAPSEVSSVWRYERKRELLWMTNATLFADLYMHFVEPHLVDARDNWDNLSHGPEYSRKRFEDQKNEEAPVRQKGKEAKQQEKIMLNKMSEKKKDEAKEEASTAASEDKDNETVSRDTKSSEDSEGTADDGTSGKAAKAVEDSEKPDSDASGKDNKPADDEKTIERGKVKKPDEDTRVSLRESRVKEDTKSSKDTTRDKGNSTTLQDLAEDVGVSRGRRLRVISDTKSEHAVPQNETGPGALKNQTTPRKKTDIERIMENSYLHQFEKRAAGLTKAQQTAHLSFEDCGKACEENKECFQWVYYSETYIFDSDHHHNEAYYREVPRDLSQLRPAGARVGSYQR